MLSENVADLRARVDPVVATCVVLLVALMAYGGYLVADRLQEDPAPTATAADPADPLDHAGLEAAVDLPGVADALVTAEEQVRDLLTLTPETIDEQLKQMSTRTTGEFQGQLEAMAPTIAKVVREGAIDSRGEVVASALSTVEKGTAQVLVVSLSAVTNKQSTSPSPRGYRFRVGVTFQGGRWLVSGIEFV